MQVINTLAPVVMLIALGVYLRLSGLMPLRKANWANNLTFWIALPALLFVETAETEISFASRADALMVLLGSMAVCILAGYAVAAMLGLTPVSTGALVQAGFRGNLAYIGIPVVVYSLGESNEKGIALAMLMVAATIPFYNLAAILVLLAGQQRFSPRIIGTVGKQLVTNPLILACVAGMTWSSLGWTLPVAIKRTLEPLGKMALPLALLSIGVTLDLRQIRGLFPPILAASLVKVGVAPLAGYLLGRQLGLTEEELRVALIMLATPTASASFVAADLLRSDSHLTAGAIVFSTLLSLVPLVIVTWAAGS